MQMFLENHQLYQVYIVPYLVLHSSQNDEKPICSVFLKAHISKCATWQSKCQHNQDVYKLKDATHEQLFTGVTYLKGFQSLISPLKIVMPRFGQNAAKN